MFWQRHRCHRVWGLAGMIQFIHWVFVRFNLWASVFFFKMGIFLMGRWRVKGHTPGSLAGQWQEAGQKSWRAGDDLLWNSGKQFPLKIELPEGWKQSYNHDRWNLCKILVPFIELLLISIYQEKLFTYMIPFNPYNLENEAYFISLLLKGKQAQKGLQPLQGNKCWSWDLNRGFPAQSPGSQHGVTRLLTYPSWVMYWKAHQIMFYLS